MTNAGVLVALTDGIKKIAHEYLTAKTQPLRNHPLALFIRDTFPAEVADTVNTAPASQRLTVQGTKLPGNWAAVPWIAIVDPRLTDSIRRGTYVVLLFSEDMEMLFLCLGIGVQDTPATTKEAWLQELQRTFQAPPTFLPGPLEPGRLTGQGIGSLYEQAVVYFKDYKIVQLPDEAELSQDILAVSDLLRRIGDSGKFRVAEFAPVLDQISITIRGREFRFTKEDVERAFEKTVESDWKERPGIEPYWHLIVQDERKPLKAVFRNMPGVPDGFGFSKDEAARAFERLGFDLINAKESDAAADLCLLGTWRRASESDAEKIREMIAAKGAWASWWSFPVREEFREQLQRPFYLYLNSGGDRIHFRLKVEAFMTTPGNQGMESPWPDYTDPEDVGKVRRGPTSAELFKTWLRVTSFESLRPSLSSDDFEPAPGVKRTALLNQSAFGYAYLRRKIGHSYQDPQPHLAVVHEQSEPVNLILYGPPGTGKTYWMREKLSEYSDAPNVVDYESWLHELVADSQWRPVIAAAMADIARPTRVAEISNHRWLRAKAKQRGLTVERVRPMLWSYLQEHTPETVPTVKVISRRPPFIFSKLSSSEWALLPDWRELDDESAELARRLTAGPASSTEDIRRYRMVTFHPSFSYEDFIRGIRPIPATADVPAQFGVVDGVFKEICDRARANPTKRYALFIDEINRANIAKVFGELITLIEVDKRAVFDSDGKLRSGMTVQLAGGDAREAAHAEFGVPYNLDIYGTMNTADRSIALLDVALRRRFEFRELAPEYELLDRQVESVHLGSLLRRINDRLEYLLDRDHRIGHAYLMSVHSLTALRSKFRLQVIPLLQEYFFDDLARVGLVLGTDEAAAPFISKERLNFNELFPRRSIEGAHAQRFTHVVTPDTSWSAASFRGIYVAPITMLDDSQPA